MDDKTQIRLELARLCYKPGLAADAAVEAAKVLESYVVGSEKTLRLPAGGEPKGPQSGGGKGR